MVMGLTKERLCKTVDRDDNMRMGLGWGEDGAGSRWGKGEKVGTTVNSINNKK